MNILILGATGPTGQLLQQQALARGDTVSVFVREPGRLKDRPAELRVFTGDVLRDEAVLTEAMRGQDVVISALGGGNSFRPKGLIERSTPVIINAMHAAGVRRLVVMSAYGVGDPSGVPFLPKLFMRTMLRDVYADKAAGEAILKRSDIDWTLAYPVALTNGPRRGYRAGEHLPLRGLPRMSRGDVADFLLNAAHDRSSSRKTIVVSS
jgi:uncharacterized protein YbjT (DUF2867 family)